MEQITSMARTAFNKVRRNLKLGDILSDIIAENNMVGTVYYVDTVNGDDDNNGKSYENAFKTMGEAFRVIQSRDRIVLCGKVREQLIAPLGVYGVTIVGGDTQPRHDLAASWMAPAEGAEASKALCEIREQGWVFQNILFVSTTTAPAVKISRAEDEEHPDGSHAQFINCRFAGVDGIWLHGGCFNCSIIGCKFYDLTGTAIKSTDVSIDLHTHLLVEGCQFVHNADCINAPLKWSVIKNNVFGENTATIDLSGGTAPNYVINNYFDIAAADFDPTGGVTGVTGDVWYNFLADAVEHGLPAD